MYILEIARGVPSESGIDKNYGIFEWDQAKALRDRGNKVVIAVPDIRSIRHKRPWGLSVYEKDGIPVVRYNFPLGAFSPKVQDDIGAWVLGKIYKTVEKKFGRPDVLHAHFIHVAGYAAVKLKEREKIPIVLTAHDSKLRVIPESKYAIEHADRVITVSEPAMDSCRQTYNCGNYVVVNNMYDSKCFAYSREKDSHGKFRFLTMGMNYERKGHPQLISAFAKALDWMPNVTLEMYSDGGDVLCEQVSSLDLDDSVEIHSPTTREVFSERLHETDCFVLPSLKESFGVVLIEAMACGCPVIATRCGGPESFVEPSQGILVEPNDVDALAKALVYMYNHVKEYNRGEIAKDVVSRFSPNAIAKQVEDVLRSACYNN